MSRNARRIAATLATSAMTVFAVTVFTFFVIAGLPGDTLTGEAWDRLDETERARFRAEWGLDKPVLTRFASWLSDAVRGDFGRSMRTRRPVTTELADRLWPTLELNLAAIALMVPLALGIGWGSAHREGTWIDHLSLALLIALYAMPVFWLAMILQDIFAVRWGWLPLYGRTSNSLDVATFSDRVAHLVLPATAMALGGLAYFARFVRGTAVEGLASIHSLFARAAGLRDSRVFVQNAIRPSLVPLATMFGLMIPGLVSGSVLIETLFAWPGLGLLFFEAVVEQDFPVIMILTTLSAVLTVAGSLMADLLSGLLDPRIERAEPGRS